MQRKTLECSVVMLLNTAAYSQLAAESELVISEDWVLTPLCSSFERLMLSKLKVFAGGAWTIGYKAWGSLLGRRLSKHGCLVCCLDYRNFPQVKIVLAQYIELQLQSCTCCSQNDAVLAWQITGQTCDAQ